MRISKHRPDYFVVDFDRPQITLCQVADQHYLKDAVLDNGRNRETLERLILIVRPDFIVHSGDLQDDSNADIDEKTGGFASFVVNDLPWTLALGNHDPDLDKVVNGFRKTVALLPLGRQDRARELFLFPPLDANNVSRVCRIDFRVDGDPRPSFGLVVFDSGGGDRLPISINANRSQLDFFVAEIARDATKDNPYGEPVDHPLLAVIHVPLPEFANVAVDAPRKGLRFEKINDEDDSHDPLPFDVLRSSGRIRGILSGHDHMNSYFGTAGPDTTMELIYGRKSGFGAYDPTDNAYGGRIIQIDLAARTYAHREIIVKANDVLAGEPLRKDRWGTMIGRELITMHDGRVLDWDPKAGFWRLWDYNPDANDILPTLHSKCPQDPMPGKCQWTTIVAGHRLVVMRDGRVLDWEPANGRWRLWDYKPDEDDILPTLHAEDDWPTLKGNELITMKDGRVLAWDPATGSWILWEYDPAKLNDVLPTKVAGGKWPTIAAGHRLVVMSDGRVLDWVPADGLWRLWDYNPANVTDVLPTKHKEGNWGPCFAPSSTLIRMHDGRVLDWASDTGLWRLWNYDSDAVLSNCRRFPYPPGGNGPWREL